MTFEDAAEATWPPLRRVTAPGFILREGAGGGQRVSAATARNGWDEAALEAAEAAMRGLDQVPLFRVRAGEDALDAALEARGYARVDPVATWHADTARFAEETLPRVAVFTLWEPLAIQREIWEAGGIGPERLAVMARVSGPKTALFGRLKDKPAGVGFCAVAEGIAFVHALEIVPRFRRQGLARRMMIGAAHWAAAEGAGTIAVLATEANDAANALYAGLGFRRLPGYHYRKAPEPAP